MRQPLHFKETQLFDWDTEPRLERSSSFFCPDEVTAAEQRRAERRRLKARRRRNATFVLCLGALSVAMMGLLLLGPLLGSLLRSALH